MRTRAQLMDIALGQVGLDSGFYAQARAWLNAVIEEQARNNKWPFYAKTQVDTAFSPGQTVYTLPSDFARPDDFLFLVQNNSTGAPVRIVEANVFERFRGASVVGNPNIAKISTTMGATAPVDTLVFDAAPSSSTSGLYFRLPYFRLPTEMSLDSTDDNKVPDFKNQEFLIESLKQWGMEHQDDSRYQAKAAEVAAKLRDAKFASQNATQQKVELAPSTFRGSRRGGAGSGGFGA